MSVTRLLVNLFLTGALVIAPAVRVLCDTSCVPGDEAALAMATEDATPECHGSPDSDHASHEIDPPPLEDDCSHGGESSSSSLFASAKGAKGDGFKVPSIGGGSTLLSVITPLDTRHHVALIQRTSGQTERFLSPLRL